jgi:hypothetical protein
MQYHFRFVSGRRFTLAAAPSSTIISVKYLIRNQFPEVDSSTVKLVHCSQVLPDSALLSSTRVTSADFIVVQHRSFRTRPTNFTACSIAPGLPVHAESSLRDLLNMGFALSRAHRADIDSLESSERHQLAHQRNRDWLVAKRDAERVGRTTRKRAELFGETCPKLDHWTR